MSLLALKSTRPYSQSSTSHRDRPYRRRGEAQRLLLLHILEHKESHDGRTPTYEELAEYMEYAHPNCARHTAISIINRNRPGRPYLIYVNDKYGWHSLDMDDKGHLMTPKGKYIGRV